MEVAVALVGIGGILGGAVQLASTLTHLTFLSNPTEGLQVVSEDEHPEVDIVFVHGLGGDPNTTWASGGKTPKVNWMTDLLPGDIRGRKHARILSFGYSTKLFSTPRVNFLGQKSRSAHVNERVLQYVPQALYLNSRNLVEELTNIRGDSARDRAIIFVAHSLGGLIVEEALVHASASIGEHSHYKALQLSTAGVLFFGTPQRETSTRSWVHILSKLMSVSLNIPSGIQQSPPAAQAELFDLQVQRYKSIEMNFPNYSFCEGETKSKDLVLMHVIPEETAVPNNAPRCWHKIKLQGSHQEMVKFTSRNDSRYQEVLKRITDCLENTNTASRRCSEYYKTLDMGHGILAAPGTKKKLKPTKIEDLKVRKSIIRVNSWTSARRRSEAEKVLKAELERSERNNGPSSSSTLELVKRLAQHNVEIEQYSKAELLYKRLFVAVQDHRGPWDPKTADILQRIAEVNTEQGNYSEATECLLRVEAIQEVVSPYDDSDTLSTRASIAILYDKQRRWIDAEKLYKQVIKAREARLGESHEDTLIVMENLALNYRMRGEKTFPQAAEYYEKVLQRRKDMIKRKKSDMKDALHSDAKSAATVERLEEVYKHMGRTKSLKELREEWPYIPESPYL